jgi:glutathione S-transferase
VLSSQLTLYVEGYFTNVWDACCHVALHEKQLEFEVARALLRDGQGVPAGLRAEAAIGRIPALQHGDFWVTESIAIVEYLEDVFPAPGHSRLFPADPRARARARQIMAWLRSDMWQLRTERPWQTMVYPTSLPELGPAATRQAGELVELVEWLAHNGALAEWSIAQVDLAFALMRLTSGGYTLPSAARGLLDAHLARPSVRAYLDMQRPPHPPPQARS